MLVTIIFIAWAFLGTIAIGLARIKTPQDTTHGRANPDAAWMAWTLMLVSWPLVILNRRNFALHGDQRDIDNPSWLAEGRTSLVDD
jgi:hypothetical protein